MARSKKNVDAVAAPVKKELKKRWKEIKSEGPEKWNKGKVVVGYFKALKEPSAPNQSHVGIVENEAEGVRKFWAPTILADRLLEVKVGDEVRITCEGKISTKRGEAWNFTVEVAEGENE